MWLSWITVYPDAVSICVDEVVERLTSPEVMDLGAYDSCGAGVGAIIGSALHSSSAADPVGPTLISECRSR